jgi:hypothetical protein
MKTAMAILSSQPHFPLISTVLSFTLTHLNYTSLHSILRPNEQLIEIGKGGKLPGKVKGVQWCNQDFSVKGSEKIC